MVQVYNIQNINAESLGDKTKIETSDYLIGKLSKIVVKVEGITDFLRLIFTDENDVELFNMIPKNNHIANPRFKSVDLVDEGVFEMPLIYGNIKVEIIGLQKDTMINEIKFYLE